MVRPFSGCASGSLRPAPSTGQCGRPLRSHRVSRTIQRAAVLSPTFAGAAMSDRVPFTPRLIHPLPAAPDFLGREAELEELRSFFDAGTRGVLGLVGLGGAGKTALAARFLARLLDRTPPKGGLFVWSFYQQPDA